MTEEQEARYYSAVHAMQSATALEITRLGENGAAADAKHLRVGLNNAMADHGTLVELLIKKGVFTIEEYEDAIVVGAERERDRVIAHARKVLNLPDTVQFV